MVHRLRVNRSQARLTLRVAAVLALLAALGYPLLPSQLQNEAQSAPALAGPLDCPMPAEEGETWIARRWIDRGQLRFECTHIAGFPVFDLPTAQKVGILR